MNTVFYKNNDFYRKIKPYTIFRIKETYSAREKINFFPQAKKELFACTGDLIVFVKEVEFEKYSEYYFYVNGQICKASWGIISKPEKYLEEFCLDQVK